MIAIGVDPNGLNINHEVGSTAPAALAAKVREMRADIGIALDGDADRVVDHRREGPPRRRRPADGGDRAGLGRGRPPRQARHRRHRHVQSRPRALSRRHRPRPRAHAGRRPLRRRGHARAGLQSRRRAVRPHHHVRLHHHRRRAGRGAAAPCRRQEVGPAGERGLPPLRAAAAGPEERPDGKAAGRSTTARSRR